jgi:hypothetical protein
MRRLASTFAGLVLAAATAAAAPYSGTGELDCAGCHLTAESGMIFAKFYPVPLAARAKKYSG